NGVVVAIMREGTAVERLQDNVNLVFEQHTVGLVVDRRAGGTEHLAFPGVEAPPPPKEETATSKAVGDGEIFRQPQGIPHRRDVKATAKFEALGEVCQMDKEQ